MRKKFRIIETIYQSRGTEVFRAVRKSDGLPVVLKMRPESVAYEIEFGLSREYELGKTLEGERSVKHLSLEQEARKPILVLRDDGVNALESEISERGFDAPRFLTLAVEIASAIEEIHARGVIHKDINPSNIIASPALDAIKLIDFGLATRISEEIVGFEPPDVLAVTFSYMSPEQTTRVNKPVDSRSGLYSLVAAFYRRITGKPPFEQTTPGELVYAHIAGTQTSVPDIRGDIPHTVSRVVDKLLKKSPDERYQTSGGLKRDLLYLQKSHIRGERIVDFQPGKRDRPAS